MDIIFQSGGTIISTAETDNAIHDNDWDPKYGYHANSLGGGQFGYTYNDRIRDREQTDGDGNEYVATTKTLMQGVEILALENNTVRYDALEVPKGEEVRVTFAVTPEQA